MASERILKSFKFKIRQIYKSLKSRRRVLDIQSRLYGTSAEITFEEGCPSGYFEPEPNFVLGLVRPGKLDRPGSLRTTRANLVEPSNELGSKVPDHTIHLHKGPSWIFICLEKMNIEYDFHFIDTRFNTVR